MKAVALNLAFLVIAVLNFLLAVLLGEGLNFSEPGSLDTILGSAMALFTLATVPLLLSALVGNLTGRIPTRFSLGILYISLIPWAVLVLLVLHSCIFLGRCIS